MGTGGTRARSPKCEPQAARSRARWQRAGASPALAPDAPGEGGRRLALFIVWAGRRQAERSRCGWGELILVVLCSEMEIRPCAVWQKNPSTLIPRTWDARRLFPTKSPRATSCAPTPGIQPVCVKSRLFPSFQYGSIRSKSRYKGLNRLGGCRWAGFRACPGRWKSARGQGYQPRNWGSTEWPGSQEVGKRQKPTLHGSTGCPRFSPETCTGRASQLCSVSPPEGSKCRTDWGKAFFVSCSSAKCITASLRVAVRDGNCCQFKWGLDW